MISTRKFSSVLLVVVILGALLGLGMKPAHAGAGCVMTTSVSHGRSVTTGPCTSSVTATTQGRRSVTLAAMPGWQVFLSSVTAIRGHLASTSYPLRWGPSVTVTVPRGWQLSTISYQLVAICQGGCG